jgi:hypothetical protein
MLVICMFRDTSLRENDTCLMTDNLTGPESHTLLVSDYVLDYEMARMQYANLVIRGNLLSIPSRSNISVD